MRKQLTILLIFIAINLSFSQNLTVKDAKGMIKGNWQLVYGNDSSSIDTTWIVDKLFLKVGSKNSFFLF